MVGSQESSWWKARRPGEAAQTNRIRCIKLGSLSVGSYFKAGKLLEILWFMDQVIELVET